MTRDGELMILTFGNNNNLIGILVTESEYVNTAIVITNTDSIIM